MVAYKRLMAAESKKFEWIIHKVTACKSSAQSKYPQGIIKKNFSNLTLCSNQEMVGILYYLLLALHNQSGHAIFEEAKMRQQEMYNSFPMKKKAKELLAGGHPKRQSWQKRKVGGNPTEHIQQTANDGELPVSAFPYQKDLLFGSNL
jgi:hypothetical protein